MTIKPKIDDQFWFDISYDMIKDSIIRLKNGAAKMETILLWAFTIYTGSAIFTVEYKHINEIGILLVLCFPYILLILGYWYAHVAQLPATMEIDYRSPTKIEKAYIDGYNITKRKLNFSKWLSFAGLLSLSISLMLAFILKNQPQNDVYLNAKINKSNSVLLVTGSFPADEEIGFQITSYYKNDSVKTLTSSILNSSTGLVYLNFPIDTVCKKFTVEAGWASKKYKYKLLKEVMITNNKNKKE